MSDAYGDPEQEKVIKMYHGKVFGHQVSPYGLKRGYLDYRTLSRILEGCIQNNHIIEFMGWENWDVVNGDDEEAVFQYFIISENGFQMLEWLTDEIVYYNDELDMYVWGITHLGTSWDYVLTDLKLEEGWD